MTANRWYEFKNVAADSAEVFIYDEIGGWGINAAQFIGELKALTGKALTVRIHSPGGSVLDGHAIFNALLRHEGGVTIQIDGLAASMAGVIAMAGKPVRMAENAFLMIHNPSGGVYGGSEDMRKGADLIDKMRDGLVNIFAKRTGKPAAEIETVMDAETWFTAQEAKDFGLIDEITDRLELAAKFDGLKNFKHLPAALVDTQREAMDATAISAELATVRETLADAQAQAQTNFQNYQAQVALVTNLTAERDDFKAKFEDATSKLSALTEDNTKLKNDLDAAQKDFVAKVNEGITRQLAASGHAPIEAEVTAEPDKPQKPDLSQLTGKARIAAAIAAQFSK